MSPDVRRIAWILCLATALGGLAALGASALRSASEDADLDGMCVDLFGPASSAADAAAPVEVTLPVVSVESEPDDAPVEAAPIETLRPAPEPPAAAEVSPPRHPPTPGAVDAWRARRDALPTPDDGWCAAELGLDPLADPGQTAALDVALEWDTALGVALHEGMVVDATESGFAVELEERVRGGAWLRIALRMDHGVAEQLAAFGGEPLTREVRIGDRIGTEVCASRREVIGRRIALRGPDGGRGGCHPMYETFVKRALLVHSGDYTLVVEYAVPDHEAEAHAAFAATLESVEIQALSAPTID